MAAEQPGHGSQRRSSDFFRPGLHQREMRTMQDPPTGPLADFDNEDRGETSVGPNASPTDKERHED